MIRLLELKTDLVYTPENDELLRFEAKIGEPGNYKICYIVVANKPPYKNAFEAVERMIDRRIKSQERERNESHRVST